MLLGILKLRMQAEKWLDEPLQPTGKHLNKQISPPAGREAGCKVA